MKTTRARRTALIQAGFVKGAQKGEVRLDVEAVARAAEISVASVYYWINGQSGRLVDSMIERALASAPNKIRRAG